MNKPEIHFNNTPAKLILFFVLFSSANIILHIKNDNPIFNGFTDITGYIIVIFLLINWLFDISHHIINVNIKKYITIVCSLCILWVCIKAIKWSFSSSEALTRYLWYFFYIPVVLLPLYSLFISLFIAKLPGYKLPAKFKLLYIPSFILIITVLTNDFHQSVFIFSTNTNFNNYSYGFAFKIIFLWSFVLITVFLIILFRKSKIPKSKQRIWIPSVCVLIYGLYCLLYQFYSNSSFYKIYDFTSATIIFCYFIFNICCYTGLINTNTKYKLIFENSAIGAYITDDKNVIKYKSKNIPDINENIVIKNNIINAGKVYWYENIEELNNYINELQYTKNLLEEENAVLKSDLEIKRKNEQLKRKIQLYNNINNEVNTQLTEINNLLNNINETQNAKNNLIDICLIATYIKRKSNLILLKEKNSFLPLGELFLCIKESLNYSGMYKIDYGINIKSQSEVKSEFLIKAYDFFENIIENIAKNSIYIYVVLSETQNTFTLTLVTENKNSETVNYSETFPKTGEIL